MFKTFHLKLENIKILENVLKVYYLLFILVIYK